MLGVVGGLWAYVDKEKRFEDMRGSLGLISHCYSHNVFSNWDKPPGRVFSLDKNVKNIPPTPIQHEP